MQDWESADADIRSPSPEPVYDPKTGLRMNTKEQRYKDKYVRERNALIAEVLVIDPTYMAPPDYKPPKKYKRLYIPDPDNPSINYIGQIIGPGGTTQ
jgi:splicing factor 1